MTSDIDKTTTLLRTPGGKQSSSRPKPGIKTNPKEQDIDTDKYLLCRQCLQIISSPAERIEVQGAHTHTFANPQGIIYEIGCFKTAKGCEYTGIPTNEYTWFRGYRWRIAMCGVCLTHLGWLFMSTVNTSFNGLILNRLVDSKKNL